MATTYTLYYPFFFIWLTTAFLSFFLAKALKRRRIKTPSGAPPPSPPALPIVGHLHLIGRGLPKSFQALAQTYGPLIQIRMGFSTCVVASNDAVAKQIFKAQDLNFSSRPEFGSSEYFIYRGSRFVTAQYGEYWRFMKKLSMTRLLSVPQLRLFADVVDDEKVRLVMSAARCADDGSLFDLSRAFTKLTNNTICRMAMSTRCSGDDEGCREMRRMVSEIMDIAGKFGVNGLFGVLKKVDLFGYGKMLQDALWRYDGVMEEIMKGYEKKSAKGGCEEKDVMDILMESYQDENAEVKLTRTQIKHFIIELLMASIDTTAATLQWTMAELINRPTILNKLRTEIDSIVGSTRLVKESDVPNLPYLRAVVKESLRLHTAAPMIPRECTQDCQVNGFQVKVNTRVLVNAYAIMRDPDTWRDPDKFEPERFLLEEDCRGDGFGFEFVAFGGGRRGCVGSRHVDVVMHTTVAALVQRFDWRVRDGEKIDISVALGFTGAMTPPLLCYPTARFHSF
ncbi:3,9-dihydroxypterocarpan 6A-monooxygenase [Linum perenne]